MIALSVAKLFFFAGKRTFSLNKAKKEPFFVESVDQFRRLEIHEKVGSPSRLPVSPMYNLLHNVQVMQ